MFSLIKVTRLSPVSQQPGQGVVGRDHELALADLLREGHRPAVQLLRLVQSALTKGGRGLPGNHQELSQLRAVSDKLVRYGITLVPVRPLGIAPPPVARGPPAQGHEPDAACRAVGVGPGAIRSCCDGAYPFSPGIRLREEPVIRPVAIEGPKDPRRFQPLRMVQRIPQKAAQGGQRPPDDLVFPCRVPAWP